MRTDHGGVPRHVDYQLTALGRTLETPLAALVDWAADHYDAVIAARADYDARETSGGSGR